MNYMKQRIIYSLNMEDVQRVANDLLDRDLTDAVIEPVKVSIAKRIDWYEVIENAILEKIFVTSNKF